MISNIPINAKSKCNQCFMEPNLLERCYRESTDRHGANRAERSIKPISRHRRVMAHHNTSGRLCKHAHHNTMQAFINQSCTVHSHLWMCKSFCFLLTIALGGFHHNLSHTWGGQLQTWQKGPVGFFGLQRDCFKVSLIQWTMVLNKSDLIGPTISGAWIMSEIRWYPAGTKSSTDSTVLVG